MLKLIRLSFVIACIYLTSLGVLMDAQQVVPISQVCIGCICEASGCNFTSGCDGDVCGPLRITWGYWADSGKPTVNNGPVAGYEDYSNCVSDVTCAGQTVRGYMAKYNRDCTGDNVINCDDYVRIHRLGGFGCTGPIQPEYLVKYQNCMDTYS